MFRSCVKILAVVTACNQGSHKCLRGNVIKGVIGGIKRRFQNHGGHNCCAYIYICMEKHTA